MTFIFLRSFRFLKHLHFLSFQLSQEIGLEALEESYAAHLLKSRSFKKWENELREGLLTGGDARNLLFFQRK